jgi:predicted TIM-barrel fold metal-dependent hydrolase
MMSAERTLMFSTDYPHWDNEFPDRVLQGVSDELKRRILFENALEIFDRLGPEVRESCTAPLVAAG